MVERGGGPTGHHNHRGLGGGLLSVCLSLYTICGLSKRTLYLKGWLEMYILNNDRKGWLVILDTSGKQILLKWFLIRTDVSN